MRQYWFRQWLVAYLAPSYYLNQCCIIVNWTVTNKLQWNFNQIQKLSFAKMHLKKSSAKRCPFCPEGLINTLRPRQNGRHFPDDIFKCIFLNENVWIPIKISLKFVPKDPINNIPALVQIMAWRRPGDKPLSEPMMVSTLTHICVTRPQWVKARVVYWVGRHPRTRPAEFRQSKVK